MRVWSSSSWSDPLIVYRLANRSLTLFLFPPLHRCVCVTYWCKPNLGRHRCSRVMRLDLCRRHFYRDNTTLTLAVVAMKWQRLLQQQQQQWQQNSMITLLRIDLVFGSLFPLEAPLQVTHSPSGGVVERGFFFALLFILLLLHFWLSGVIGK